MAITDQKVLSFDRTKEVFDALRREGKRIVQCHGTFDLVHPGHICHLEEAKALGDVLVVTITGEKFVNKGPGRPYFNDNLRAKSLAALVCVDYVTVAPHPTAIEAIERVKPHVYCKGREYQDASNDVTGNIHDDVRTVEQCGGRVAYIGDTVFSSTKLLNNHLDHLPDATKAFCKDLARSYPPVEFQQAVDAFQNVRVLLVGDIIFDKYSYVKVQGLTSKASIVSVRHLYEELQPGGTLAIYRHLKEFTPNVKLASILGTEEWVQNEVRQYVSQEDDLIVRDVNFTSVVKHRFVSPFVEDKELVKHFSVNYLDHEPPNERVIQSVLQSLQSEISQADLVMVADFGHGVMQKAVRDMIQAKARYLALNCQTNSYNHGFNIINRQYSRVNCFCLDRTEILLAVGRRDISYMTELERIKDNLSSEYAWLTRGEMDTVGLHSGEGPCSCPTLEMEITDTVGAGDAFFSIASLAALKKYPNMLATFLGQLAGAQAVGIVGNTRPISKAVLLKSGMSLLNY